MSPPGERSSPSARGGGPPTAEGAVAEAAAGREARITTPRGVYVIVDAPDPSGLSPAEVADAAASGGASFVQLRAKAVDTPMRVVWLREMVEAVGGRAAIVVNDDADAAFAVSGVWGLHLGHEDLDAFGGAGPAAQLRARLTARGLGLGLSTHCIAHVEAALRHGPDYVGFGPIHATRSKADTWPVVGVEGLREVTLAFPTLPVVAIGGLGEADAGSLARAGTAAMAVIGAARAASADGVRSRTRALHDAWRHGA